MVKVAAVQMDVAFQQVDRNMERIISILRETAAQGSQLTVFPECAVCGYCFDSLEEALPFAQTIPGPATEALQLACAETHTHAVVGMLERDTDRLFNAAVLVGPGGLVGSYRKVHLPYLGVDMHTTFGDRPFAVQQVGDLQVGMNICYDAAFPEAARALALLGADLIVLPTNWPPGAECTAASVINARALENAVYYLAANRVGMERGFRFIGRSKIVDPNGCTLAETQGTGEEILYATLDLTLSRRKHIIRVPGKHEIDRMADRRPDMYRLLIEPHALRSPGGRSVTEAE